MRFKLSVRELEILDKDRIKILTKLRESHLDKTSSKGKHNKSSSKKKPMKPPILLVPLDDSRLFCIIQTCDEYDEATENKSKEQEEAAEKASWTNDCCKKSTQRKQERNGGIKKKTMKNTSSITIEDTFCDNPLENNAIQNVPTTYDQIFPANLEASEVILFLSPF